jgi:hypothetical protein
MATRILLGTVGGGQFIGEMGVVENRPRSATARAAPARDRSSLRRNPNAFSLERLTPAGASHQGLHPREVVKMLERTTAGRTKKPHQNWPIGMQ